MPEPLDPRSIIEAAEQAAAAGNHASAEELLREAARLQEASLGPLHPDLANTLNNLGVVCEITGNTVDAERHFRRALTIATTALEPDHPFVATSRKNLREFCEAQGKPFELPAPSPVVAATLEMPPPAPADPPQESQLASESQDSQPLVQGRRIHPVAIGVVGAGAALIVTLATARPWLGSIGRPQSSPAIAKDLPREIPPPPRAPSVVEPIALPNGTTKTVASGPEAVTASRVTTASTAARPTLVRARLCADLDEWRCDPPDRPIPSGPLFFYTQVKSTSTTKVQHRWYRNDRLHQSVELRVQASPGVGYRTYSRETMSSESAGNWRVELRTEDGVLLHEERFSVR